MAAAKRVQIKQRLELQFGNGKQVQVPDDLLVEDWLSVCSRIHCSHLPFLFVVQAKANFPAFAMTAPRMLP